MAIWVIGRGGYIARRLMGCLPSREMVRFTTSNDSGAGYHLDLLKPEFFEYSNIQENDTVLLLAAISSPDVCHNKYEFSYAVNVAGTCFFVEKCLQRGAKVLFFSSDTVYGGGAQLFNENSACVPTHEYAKMKSMVEQKFADRKNFKVFRLSAVMSWDDKYISYLRKCCDDGVEAEIFHPFERRVVYIMDLIEAIKIVCARWEAVDASIFNICGPELLSRAEMARCFKEIVDNRLRYRVVKPEAEFFLSRPTTINMGSLRFAELIGGELRTFRSALLQESALSRQ